LRRGFSSRKPGAKSKNRIFCSKTVLMPYCSNLYTLSILWPWATAPLLIGRLGPSTPINNTYPVPGKVRIWRNLAKTDETEKQRFRTEAGPSWASVLAPILRPCKQEKFTARLHGEKAPLIGPRIAILDLEILRPKFEFEIIGWVLVYLIFSVLKAITAHRTPKM